MNSQKWIVHKFGGTSVGSVMAFKEVLKILTQEPANKVAVVVSAMSGVTDRLIRAAELASTQNPELEAHLKALFEHHLLATQELLNPVSQKILAERLTSDFKDLREILRGVFLARHLPESTLEMISGYGEIWSSQILAELWRNSRNNVNWQDARQILVVESSETSPRIRWDLSQQKMDQALQENPDQCFVITGFIASTVHGVPTTLKRNGSDFSASIFGKLLKAREIVIWTDVDGVYSADPRKVPESQCLKELSYQEAIELAYFGAKVIHPHTMGPAVDLNIPILIKNTFNPTAPGTYIHQIENHDDGLIARGFTTVDQISLINVEGNGMIGIPGVAQRLFGALKEVGVSVILISQASSEHSICFAVPNAHSERAQKAIREAFAAELIGRQIQLIQEISPCSILAMVGDNMVEKIGVAARFFQSLSRAGVSVRAIAQGSSERNISVVIDQKEATRALRATHSAFFLSEYTISLGLIGYGNIGKTFIRQISDRKNHLREKFNLDVRVRAVTDSKSMWLADKDLDLMDPKSLSADQAKPLDLKKLLQHIKADHLPHSCIIDCSSNDLVADQYAEWLADGVHVITPNKKAGSGVMDRYQKIKSVESKSHRSFLYEATVGAGLPIISTLRDLLQTGDEIISIEGILSGTLSFIFNQVSSAKPFSEVLKLAKEKGYTEPDPRDDLSGMDVGRKVVILAREAGFKLNLADVKIESLVPKDLAAIKTSEEFMQSAPKMDAEFQKLCEEADRENQVLRFTGYVNAKGEAQVGLRKFPKTHPFARVSATDNIISFRTKRYDQQPLIVQGPGAGPEVTAGGIFADLLRLARSLGASA